MGKMRLTLESLQVESFVAGVGATAGTVVAHESEDTGGWSNCNCSMIRTCDPGGETCANTCGEAATIGGQVTCFVTCNCPEGSRAATCHYESHCGYTICLAQGCYTNVVGETTC